MPFYAINVTPGREEPFVKRVRRLSQSRIKLIWPRRILRTRRRGTWSNKPTALFPGYVFIEADAIRMEDVATLRPVPGFLRFLRANDNIQPLSQGDEALLRHFIAHGETVGRSLVSFDENDRIVVSSGPLKGLEGRIVSVDRRKQRAKVVLDFSDSVFRFDLGYREIERADRQTSTTDSTGSNQVESQQGRS